MHKENQKDSEESSEDDEEVNKSKKPLLLRTTATQILVIQTVRHLHRLKQAGEDIERQTFIDQILDVLAKQPIVRK